MFASAQPWDELGSPLSATIAKFIPSLHYKLVAEVLPWCWNSGSIPGVVAALLGSFPLPWITGDLQCFLGTVLGLSHHPAHHQVTMPAPPGATAGGHRQGQGHGNWELT